MMDHRTPHNYTQPTHTSAGRHCHYCGSAIQAAFYLPTTPGATADSPSPGWACPPCYFQNYLPSHARQHHMVAYGEPLEQELAGVA